MEQQDLDGEQLDLFMAELHTAESVIKLKLV